MFITRTHNVVFATCWKTVGQSVSVWLGRRRSNRRCNSMALCWTRSRPPRGSGRCRWARCVFSWTPSGSRATRPSTWSARRTRRTGRRQRGLLPFPGSFVSCAPPAWSGRWTARGVRPSWKPNRPGRRIRRSPASYTAAAAVANVDPNNRQTVGCILGRWPSAVWSRSSADRAPSVRTYNKSKNKKKGISFIFEKKPYERFALNHRININAFETPYLLLAAVVATAGYRDSVTTGLWRRITGRALRHVTGVLVRRHVLWSVIVGLLYVRLPVSARAGFGNLVSVRLVSRERVLEPGTLWSRTVRLTVAWRLRWPLSDRLLLYALRRGTTQLLVLRYFDWFENQKSRSNWIFIDYEKQIALLQFLSIIYLKKKKIIIIIKSVIVTFIDHIFFSIVFYTCSYYTVYIYTYVFGDVYLSIYVFRVRDSQLYKLITYKTAKL